MNIFNLLNPSRRKSVKILAIGNYSILAIDIIQGLVFVPLYIHYLGVHLYGLWLGTGGLIAALGFFDMGIASISIQRISREYGARHYEGISKYFFNGLLINLFFMAMFFIVGLFISFNLDTFFPSINSAENALLTNAVQISLVALIFSLINNTIEGALNALQQPLFGKVSQFIGTLLGILVIYLLLTGKQPLKAIPFGMLTKSLLTLVPNTIYLTILFIKNGIELFNPKWATIKEYLRLTPSLMLSKIGTSLAGNIEPTLINAFVSPEIAVYFSVTKKAGTLIQTFLDRIGGIIYPSMSHLHAEGNSNQYREFFINLLRVVMPAGLMMFMIYFILNEHFITVWVGRQNYLGDLMTALIGGSLLVSFISNFLSYLLNTTGDIKFSNNTVFIESAIKIALLYLFLKIMGIIGLPIAIGLGSLIFIFIYSKRWVKHLGNMELKIKWIAGECILSSISLSIGTFFLYYLIDKFLINDVSRFILIGTFTFLIMTSILIISNPIYKKNIKKWLFGLKTM